MYCRMRFTTAGISDSVQRFLSRSSQDFLSFFRFFGGLPMYKPDVFWYNVESVFVPWGTNAGKGRSVFAKQICRHPCS